MNDAVNRPAHYTTGDIEAIDAIRAALGEDGFRAFCRGNAIKYLWRAEHKGQREQDLAKAVWYSRMASGDDPRVEPIELAPPIPPSPPLLEQSCPRCGLQFTGAWGYVCPRGDCPSKVTCSL